MAGGRMVRPCCVQREETDQTENEARAISMDSWHKWLEWHNTRLCKAMANEKRATKEEGYIPIMKKFKLE